MPEENANELGMRKAMDQVFEFSAELMEICFNVKSD